MFSLARGQSKPSNHPYSIVIYIGHSWNLLFYFHFVLLVETNAIGPKPAVEHLSLPSMIQELPEILVYPKIPFVSFLVIYHDISCWGTISPYIG